MKRRLLACFGWCTIGAALPASAQQVDLDGSLGVSDRTWRVALASQWRLTVGSRLTLGTGLRLTHYNGEPSSYRNQGAVNAALPERLDIDPAVWGLNLIVSAQARVVGSLAAGANIDLIGVAAGPSRQSGTADVKPSRGSLLLYGDNDRGSLNSEFFLAVAVGRRIELRGGLSHYVTGYRASDGTIATRYLRFETVPFLGIRWR